MAYISQEKKKEIEVVVKEINKKYGVKARLSVRDHSSLVINITEGSIDFIGNFNKTAEFKKEGNIQVNHYSVEKTFTDKAKDYLVEVIAAMNSGNHNNNDLQSDYFDVGWYINVNVGKWDKPYKLTK